MLNKYNITAWVKDSRVIFQKETIEKSISTLYITSQTQGGPPPQYLNQEFLAGFVLFVWLRVKFHLDWLDLLCFSIRILCIKISKTYFCAKNFDFLDLFFFIYLYFAFITKLLTNFFKEFHPKIFKLILNKLY